MPKQYSLYDKKNPFTSDEQLIVQILSVIYEPIGITKLTACSNKIGATQENGRQHSGQSLKLALARLIKQKIIVEDQKRFSCPLHSVESHTIEAIKSGMFPAMVRIIHSEIPVKQYHWNGPKSSSWEQAVREVRIALYSGNEEETLKALEECDTYYRQYTFANPLIPICFQSFDPQWFENLPKSIISIAVTAAFRNSLSILKNLNELLEWVIKSQDNAKFRLESDVIYEIAKFLILQGDIKRALSISKNADDYHKLMLQGSVSFIKGENDTAIDYFNNSLIALKKTTRKRIIFIEQLSGVFYILALFRRGQASDIKKISKLLTAASKYKDCNNLTYELLSYLVDFVEGHPPASYYFQMLSKWPAARTAFEYYMTVLILSWTDLSIAKSHYNPLAKCANDVKSSGYQWLLGECYSLLSRLNKTQQEKNEKLAQEIQRPAGFISIVDVIKTKEPWERALDALSGFHVEKTQTTSKKQSRLVWILSIHNGYLESASLKEQKKNAKGGWSAGRQVALKRLYEDLESFDCLTEHDVRASKAIIPTRDYWGVSYDLNYSTLLLKLVGHPLLFSSEKHMPPIELIKGAPEIQITKKGKHLIISMRPAFDYDAQVTLIKNSDTQWSVIESTPEQQQLALLVGEGLKIPGSEKDRVLSTMSAIAPFVNIHSDIGGSTSDAKVIDADSQLHLLLSPQGDGLKIEARTQIFSNKGPYYQPGNGGKTIIAEIGGERLQTTRNLALEKKQIKTTLAECPTLNLVGISDGEWLVPDPEQCLEILFELQKQTNALVSWPEGEKLKVNQSINLSDLKVKVKKDNDWFSATAEIALDDGQVLNMARLIELTKAATGRFISLQEGQFIALTDTFKNRISDLDTFGEIKGDQLKLHPLAALGLEDIANEATNFKSDKHWKSYISRFHEAMELTPTVPSTLQTELRDYQKEGFQWLARLAHWGVGACLADDMGLGKTIQTLALLLYRATNGPALIVAPTSVAMNWMDEITRFSPTLNIIDYRESKRDEVLKKLDAFDIVICSYGLIQNNIKQIETVKWATVILDEAQAIKNSATKRSQAIMRIQADVKVILTGTPIENHLGELWNLFRFINPGLLGSMESFNSRFANPIVKGESLDSQQKLKKLIHPYILRRTKTQVLTELPSRTEIALHVEMSKEEAAFYEALRREAVNKFSDNDSPKGHRQLQILAEIMRLRRACCNPALVLKAGAPASSKLALFASVVQELLDNNHKALVFSQFVDHLSILKEKLDDMNINYQYLDGSTPAKRRKKIVTEFQSGIGDIFLISLKAGGVGLNLTAADYVIHMDPWWNPAVEDQASDRAHRIGQKRPVTVYRMITKNTIEEKIVALHKGKRDLADNLLSGSDVAGKVNIEELLSLLQEN